MDIRRFVRGFFVGSLVVLFSSVFLNASALTPELVWSVEVEGEQAQVTVNRFDDLSYGKTFPLAALPVSRMTDTSQPLEHGRNTNISLSISFVPVSPQGLLQTDRLAFMDETLSSFDPASILVRPEDLPVREDDFPVPHSYVNLSDIPGQEVQAWELHPQRKTAVVHTQESTFTFALEPDEGNPDGMLGLFLGHTHSGVFSKDGSRFASVGQERNTRRVLVFNEIGELIFEGEPTAYEYRGLHFTSNGQTLIFDRQQSGTRVWEVIALNTATGEERVIGAGHFAGRDWIQDRSTALPAGYRYYSGDGTKVVVIQPTHGLAFYFDVTDPFNPVALAEYQASGSINTAAVCDDGSLVALRVSDSTNPPGSALYFDIILLDETLQPIGEPLLRGTVEEGLQFDGKFLFVGTQNHPSPPPHRTTSNITLFDLEN